tara:strand:- start:442 stop:1128 length:687 start_codon:yes stop_codon:yes gene_type:complete
MIYILPSVIQPVVPVVDSDEYFPVRRIFCVGQNYADHVLEMGANPDREPPFFFSKPADGVVINNENVSYPPMTENLHHEVELVVAIGKLASNIEIENASSHIYGYAVGNDLTRRDIQTTAKKRGWPWDVAKGFDQSAPISAIVPITEIGEVSDGHISLSVNGAVKQQGDLSQMIWSVSEIMTELSKFYQLMPGDLIFTGTPAGVGPLVKGDLVEANIEGIGKLSNKII